MLAPPDLDGVLSLEQQIALLPEEEQDAIFAALEADGVDLEELLYDWNWGARPQQFLDPEDESWSVALLLGGRGCITGDARVFLPLENRHERIDVLARDGKQIWVQTVNGPALTLGAPFLKGVAPTYRFSTEDGREVIVTGGHRFLTPQGWQRADSVREGQLLASASAVPPFEGVSTALSLQGAQRSSRTGAGSRGGCSTYHGPGDQPLLPTAGFCQPCSPSRGGDSGHVCASLSPSDVLATEPVDTHACQPSSHAGPAKMSFARAWLSARAAGSRALPGAAVRSPRTTRESAQVLDWSDPVLPLPGVDLPTRRLVRLVHEGVSSALPTSRIRIGWSRVRRVSQAGTRPYYDMTVPGENHYLAEGLFHHNSGKSRAATEWVRKMDLEWPQNHQRWGSEGGLLRGALLSRTAADVRDTLLNGPSGLLHIYPPSQQDLIDWIPSRRLLILPGGSEWLSFSAEEPDQLRGPAFHAALADELAAHRGKPGVDGLIAWDNLRIACRMGRTPQIVASTTPKRVPVMRKLVSESADPAKKIIMRRMRTLDNPYLSASYLDVLTGLYAGTTIGAQELEGVMLDDVKGATTSDKIIDAYRIKDGKLPAGCMGPGWLRFVGVDPSVAEKPNDECGIVVVMVPMIQPLHARHAYVVDDVSLMASPAVWSDVVVQTALKYKATVIVESNQGGELVRMSVKHAAERANVPVPAVRKVWASTDKKTRAEPIGIAYERGRVHHINVLPELESQLCLTAGTLVATDRGQVPIEEVTTQDKVWTRDGLSTLKFAGQTGVSSTLTTITHEFGVVTCTPCHLIWTKNRGFVPAQSVLDSDLLDASRALIPQSRGAATGGGATLRGTSGHGEYFCTELSGKHIMDKSPKGCTSTMLKGVATTGLNPYNCSLRRSTEQCTTQNEDSLPGGTRSALSTLYASGTGGTVRFTRVLNVETHSVAETCALDSAHGPVETDSTIEIKSPVLQRKNAWPAENRSYRNGQTASTAPRDARTESRRGDGVPVYDLSVSEGAHEFYANGVLVHNCEWVPGESGYSPDHLDAAVWAISAGLYPESLKSGAPGQATSASPNRVQGVRRAPTRQINVARQASRR